MAFQNKTITYEEFLELVRKNNPNANIDLIAKAYKFSERAHKGQRRSSGEEFFEHPVETARILINMRADTVSICAALMHDIVEDTNVSTDKVREEFGEEVATIVEAVTKIKDRQFPSKEEWKAENLRKLLFATTKDVRVVLIKLADRLHNMRTIATFRPEKRKRIAQETLEIYAPIAHKLGLWRIKGELEDLSLRYLDYDTYKILREQIQGTRAQREAITAEIVSNIQSALKEKGIEAEVLGRAKYFYSIYKKMIKKQREFDQIYDLIAIRIIVDSIPECYKVLSVIHSVYEPQLDRFKDYIQHPKANGYQSIHTAVLYEGKMLEVQIRTREMHYIAEYGIAAHWAYKDIEEDSVSNFDRRIIWLRQILDWLHKSKDAKSFVENLKIDLFENEIIVMTPKGDPISLPERATPIDFAYAIHSRLGDQCSKAKVNGSIVTLDYQLHSGDIVEIITQNNAKPSRNWLNFVVTAKARNKIRHALGMIADTQQRKHKGAKDEEEKTNILEHIDFVGKPSLLKISKCCEPKVGDPIVGFYTKDGKVTVHKKDCINVHTLDPDKKVDLRWKSKEEDFRKIKVFVSETPRILAELLKLLSSEKMVVSSVNTRMRKKRVLLSFKVKDAGQEKLDKVAELMKAFPEVEEIRID